MARPLRTEFAGALYHVIARGNARQDIFLSDADRENFLELLHRACDRYQWFCHAFCLMSNHYHLLIEIQAATLSKGMKYINGGYTQNFNRRHKRVGHVFQGRFKGILVEKDSHLLELSRYIVLNPVRAEMVRSAQDWPRSSYRATAGLAAPPPSLTTDWILGNFGSQRATGLSAINSAREEPTESVAVPEKSDLSGFRRIRRGYAEPDGSGSVATGHSQTAEAGRLKAP